MNNIKVKFGSNYSLNFGASDETRTYGFSYESFHNNILSDQISYEIEVTFKDLGGNYIFEINRSEIYLNNKTSFSQIEKIAFTASNAIFPLRIKVKSNCQIDTILNKDQIRNRWSTERKKIAEYYKGKIAENIIAKIDILFSDEYLLNQAIAQNWFFNLFFKPLYISYSEKLRVKYISKSPVFGNQFIEYDVVQTVQENYSEDDKININVDGIAIDKRTIDEILSGYNFPKSTFSGSEQTSVESKMNIDYKLYKEDRSIYSVAGTFETKIDKDTYQKIQVEIYHLTQSSSYKPESDEKKEASLQMFQSWQTAKDDIIDVSKPKWQVPNAPKTKIPKSPQERIELFVGVGPDVKANPGFWDWIKSLFKK